MILFISRYKQELCRKGSTSSRPADKIGFSTIDGEPSSSSSSPSPFPTAHIQEAIYKSIEENDSLLRGLITPQPLPDAITQSAIKTPKDDKTVIEELQINNNELRQLVDKLITELDKYVQENARLKAEVQKLKSKLNSHPGSSERHKLNVINDTDSPFILLPGGDLSPVGSRPLPNLPPLEMPSFDFNSIRPSTDT